jgi:hypothetical protein
VTAVTHATRTEVEVAADAIVLLIRSGWRPQGVKKPAAAVMEASRLTGLSLLALRDADQRIERFRYQAPKPRPILPGGPPETPHRAPAEPVTPVMLPTAETQWCSGCQRNHTLDAFTAGHAQCDAHRERRRREHQERKDDTRARDTSHRALVRALAPVTDIRLTDDKSGFVLVCARCRREIGKGEAVVCMSCAVVVE